jgi:Xaa-Pro aminopeptidase
MPHVQNRWQGQARREALRRLFSRVKVASLLVTDELNVTYLTGFSGDSSYFLISGDRELLITDGRYTQQLAEECPELELAVRGPDSRLTDFAAEVIGKLGLASVGIEGDVVTVSFYEKLRESLKSTAIANTSNLIESLREIKDDEEIAAIRQAVKIAEQAFLDLGDKIAIGQSEKRVADELEYAIRLGGGTCGAFPSIVGVGPRAALPHGRPTPDAKIGDHDFVLIDWGARWQGYHSDLTRVLVTGKLSPQLQKVYEVVLAAQAAAIAVIRPGAVMKDVDGAARRVIDDAGYSQEFNHSLGHGLGLAVHELPRLAPDQERKLAPGMVVTVEPGIYIPDVLGVRIEDDVLVTPDGHEILTSVPKQLADCVP